MLELLEFLDLPPGDTYSEYWVLNGQLSDVTSLSNLDCNRTVSDTNIILQYSAPRQDTITSHRARYARNICVLSPRAAILCSLIHTMQRRIVEWHRIKNWKGRERKRPCHNL